MIKKCFVFLLPLYLSATCLNAKEGAYNPGYIPETSSPVTFKAKDFSYLLGTVKGIDDELLKMHFTLYNGYVKSASELAELLLDMRHEGKDQALTYGALERRFVWEFDGMVLHEYYFANLGVTPIPGQKDPLTLKITEDFGSVNQWESNFKATGMIRGVGWVILYQNPKTGHLSNVWVDEHNINLIPGGKPLLVMDVWEHAYISEYGLDRAGYIDAFFKNINWKEVSRRFLEGVMSTTETTPSP